MARIYTASSWRNQTYDHNLGTLKNSLPQHSFYNFKDPKCSFVFQWESIDRNWSNWTPYQFRAVLNTNFEARQGFISDKTGLDWCDICVLILPCGRSAHLELGYAVGRGKSTVVLLRKNFEPELMYKFVDYLAIDLQDLIDFLQDYMP